MLFRLSRLLLIIAIGAAAGASLALSASVSQGLETDVAVTTTPAPRPPTSEADVGPSAGLPTSGSGGYLEQLVESPSHLLLGPGPSGEGVILSMVGPELGEGRSARRGSVVRQAHHERVAGTSRSE